ncbi:MAG: class I SAM-dependent methyltransferase [Chitinophagaceae bacterium]
MRLKIQPENPLEWMALRMNLAPTPLVDTQIAFNAARAIMAGAELGIYEALGKKPKSAEAIAATCKTDPHATTQLLNCLVGTGYIKWTEGLYSLKPKYYKWLLQEYDSNIVAKLRFQLAEWNYIANLENYVRTGQSMQLHSMVSEHEWSLYQEGMRDLSTSAAKELAKKIPVPKNATQLLDIGGSHGMFSIELCRKYPALNSTILELPAAIEAASAIAKRYDDTRRINYRAGNALTDELGTEQYDMVMINNVVHHFTPEQNKALAIKVARALKPGGVFLIGEFIRASKPGEGGMLAAASGIYFSVISASGNWSVEEMSSWQKDAGLNPGKILSPMTIPGWKMIVARK